jgi:hypothetical protein
MCTSNGLMCGTSSAKYGRSVVIGRRRELADGRSCQKCGRSAEKRARSGHQHGRRRCPHAHNGRQQPVSVTAIEVARAFEIAARWAGLIVR